MAGDIELGGIPNSSRFNYKLSLVSTPLYMATFRDLNSSQDASTKLRYSSALNSTMGGTSVSMEPQLLGMLNNLFVKNESSRSMLKSIQT
jgi:hypothetical protein